MILYIASQSSARAPGRAVRKEQESVVALPATVPAADLPASFASLLGQLMRCPSVVGAEHSFFRSLQRELEERGATVTWYEGLLVAHGARPDSLYLSSHIDRHGLICTGPNEFQYAAFVAGARSDLLGNSVGEQFMRKISNRFHGEAVFAYEPWSGSYRGNGHIEDTYICERRNNLIFTLRGLEHLVAGTPVAFMDRLRLHGATISGQLDNVLTASALVYLFERGFEGTAFFTAQEEAGKSWRYLLEWFRRFGSTTNHLIVVDTSPFPNLDDLPERLLVLRNRDANAEFNRELTAELATLCETLGIAAIYKDEYVAQLNARAPREGGDTLTLGSTELGRIVSASNGLVDGTTLQIPTSGYHTLGETARLSSVRAFLELLEALATAPE